MGDLFIINQNVLPSPRLSIETADINLLPIPFFSNSLITQKVSIILNKEILTEGKDYLLYHNRSINVGKYTLIIYGINKYKGIVTIDWSIKKEAFLEINNNDITIAEGISFPVNITKHVGGRIIARNANEIVDINIDNNIINISGKKAGSTIVEIISKEDENYNEKIQLITVNVQPQLVFGVMWNYNNTSSVLTRLTPENDPNEYVNTTITSEPISAIENTVGSSPFDEYYPWKEMEEYNIINSKVLYKQDDKKNFSRTSYDTVVYIPTFYYKIKKDTNNKKHYFYISNSPLEDFDKHPGSNVYIGKYLLYIQNTKTIHCKSGRGRTLNTRNTFRTNIKNLGSKWALLGLHHVNAIQLLYLIEYADWDCQTKIGLGKSLASTASTPVTGKTDSMEYHTGCLNNIGTGDVIYRNIEGLWNAGDQYIDGINFNGTSIYYCNNPEYYADNTTENYTLLNFSLPTGGTMYGTPELIYDNENPWIILGNKKASSSETAYGKYIPDYFGTSTTEEWKVFKWGGQLSGGLGGGLFCYNCIVTSTNSSGAARPVFTP